MSTSLHAVFNLVFGSVYFALVIFKIYGRKMRISASSQNLYPKTRFLVSLRSFFSTCKVFPGRGLLRKLG